VDRQRWQRVTAIFERAIDLSLAERAAILDSECESDPSLRAEVELLLARDSDPGTFLSPLPPASALQALEAAPEAGRRRFGSYTTRGVLGRGGTSVVFEAEQDSPQRTVALKVLRALPMTDELTLRLYQREVRALARLGHPSIAAVYEAGRTDDGWHYVAMEKVDGEPITRFARRAGLDVKERLALFQRVCEAVHYAHQRGVVHRDLKPSNILIADGPGLTGTPKVLDFGLARIAEADGSRAVATLTGLFEGTPAYMSPEQAGGRSAEVDVRTDVYSLGVVLYELLTNRLPYEVAALPLPEAVRVVREQTPVAAGTVRRELRGDPETILSKALAKDPDMRYASAASLGEDIQRYLGGQPIAAHPPSALYQVKKLVQRHRVPASLLATLALVVAASAAVTGWLALRFAEQRDTASRERTAASEFAAFLEQLFEHASPLSESRREPSLRQVLDDGYESLESIDDELVRARVMTMMGRAYTQLDQMPRAVELLAAAVDIRRRRLGETHQDTIETLGILAAAQLRAGDPDAADISAADVVRLRLATLGPDDPLIADAWSLRGEGRFYAGDYAGAEAHLREALAIRRRIAAGRPDPQLAAELSNVGLALARLGRPADAEPILHEAVEIRKAIGDTEQSLMSMEALGQCLWLSNRAKSEAIYAEELALARSVFRPDHPRLAWVLTNYAYTVDMNHGPAEAEPLFLESVAIYRQNYAEHPERHMAWALDMLAANLKRQERFDEARPLLEEALGIYEAVLGPENPLTLGIAQKLRDLPASKEADAAQPAK
jgi:serine/threonine protein kinase/tetratricopeptide (TPR) repeat protein